MPADRWTRVAFSVQDARVLQEEESTIDALRGIQVSVSPAVDNGGAIVEIENGAVDTRITAALARAAAALDGDDQVAEVIG